MTSPTSSEQRPTGSQAPSLLPSLLPGLVILVLLLWSAALVIMWHRHQERMAELIVEDVRELTTNLRVTLNMQSAGLATAIQPIAGDAEVRKALAGGAAAGLQVRWRPVFEAMHRERQVTHLYFSNRYRICLLRVHVPAQHGDRIDRYTTRAAERTGKTAAGLEIGPRGTLALRVVQPVYDQGTLVGYVEMGKEIEDVLSTLRSRMEMWNQMAVVVHKDGLDPEAWQHVQSQQGREADWDLMPHHVVAIASQDHLTEAFADWVKKSVETLADRRGREEVISDGKHFRVMAAPLRDASGAEIGALLAMRDITAERQSLIQQLLLVGSAGVALVLMLAFLHRLQSRAKQRIRDQQDRLLNAHWRLENILSASRVGTWEWDIATGVIQVSERWSEILGYAPLGPMDRAAWERLFHPDDLPVVQELLERHFKGEAPYLERECRLQHREGHWTWILCRGRVFTRSEAGEPLQLFGTHSDISARKRAEEEHLKLQQQKMARELGEMTHANRLVALGTMMAGLAHEFNHPAQVVMMNQKSLRGMVSACADAARDFDGPAVGLLTWPEVATLAPQLLDDMELATTQLNELIENVQNYAKPSEGLCHDVEYDMLISVARSSIRLVASYARRRQVAVISELDSDGGVPTGCNCMQQVVVNLLLNAIQASQSGESVTVACQRRDGQVSLTVSDRGPGIDPAVLAKLGQPFVTTKQEQGGHGLGLFICLQIVVEQGGVLELTANTPHGTVARMTFPDADPP